MIKVLVVDDHDMVRTSLINTLRGSPGITVAGEAADGRTGIELALALRPDAILMDVRMPDVDGHAATRTILRAWPEARVIAVTACDDEAAARQLIRAGAIGYVTKNADIDALLTAIRRACQGQQYLSEEVAQCLGNTRLKAGGGPFDDLSGREMEIFKQVVAGRKAKEIARKLYITSQTVHTYRYRIFEKLGVHSDVELTRMAMQHGLIKDSFS